MTRKTFDVVFLHPPFTIGKHSLLDKIRFWKRNVIAGEFAEVPMGFFSMASLLEREGFDVRIFNLALEQTLNPSRRIESFLKSLESRIYAIDLHWFVHSLGSLEIAELCKKYHPNSFVILGGFTATYYDLEIMQSYRFIDAIARGESEYVLLNLAKMVCSGKEKNIKGISGLTYRLENSIKWNKLAPPPNLNKLRFSALELMENWDKQLKCCARGYEEKRKPSFWLTIGRGCLKECIYCGGARSCYQLLTGRANIGIREINNIVEDIARLIEFGVKIIKFNHDPEMFGRRFSFSLLNSLKGLASDLSVYWESTNLPSRDFIKETNKTFINLNVAISPESMQESVRKLVGRSFTNEQMLKTIRFLDENEVITDIYFLIGLPGDSASSISKIVDFTKEVAKRKHILVQPPIPYTIDPHCPMAINSQKYGVKIFFKSFHHYRKACLESKWDKWIGHETETLTRAEISRLTASVWRSVLEVPQEGAAAKISFDYETD